MFRTMLIAAGLAGYLMNPEPGAGGGTGAGAGTGADASGKGAGGGTNGDKGDTDDAGDGATFDQAALNAAIAKERRNTEKKLRADFDKTTADLQAKIADLEARTKAADDAKALEGKTGADRDLAAAQGTIKRLEAELKTIAAEREKIAGERDGALSRFRTREAERTVGAALAAKGALGDAKAIAQATRLMMQDGAAEVTEDENGAIAIAFTIGDKRYEDPARAAELWLAENPHFAKAPAGGSGGKGPNAGNGRGSVPLADRSPSDLIGAGWSREPPTR